MPVSTQGLLLGGRYRVLRHLGSGGMASVLLCRDERLDRDVAVKRLHADSPADVEQRFVREAKLGASLNHPNLVSVFDTAVDDEGVLIVMEHVDGEALAKALLRGPLEFERVAGMARELGDALDHAHGHGVVHRDVKPSNVLLRRDGVTKLVDLGIATAADQTRITRSGIVLGTAAYMAPEQLDGRRVGPAADVYAFAAVCFEALSGLRPRPGRTPVEIAHRIATEEPPDLRMHLPDAPAGVAEALRRGLAREPQGRPASAGELASELAGALERRRPSPRPAATPGAPTPRAAGRPLAAIALAVALLVLAAAGVIAAVLASGDGGGPPQRVERRSPPAPKKPAPERPAAQQPSPAPSPASGAQLNQQGFGLMQQGEYQAAIPILQRAVASFEPGSGDLNYAYALFNLGKSLRLAGRPQDAVPILEQRLRIPDQTGTVLREVEAARRAAGRR